MGDRANIIVKENRMSGGVVLYTHQNGHVIHKTLEEALAKGKDRWDDAQYLAGIIYKRIVQVNDSLYCSQGDGISNAIWDNDYPVFVLYCENLELQVKNLGGGILCTIPFEKFVTKPLSDYIDLEVFGLRE
jgi:hypothetical protein